MMNGKTEIQKPNASKSDFPPSFNSVFVVLMIIV